MLSGPTRCSTDDGGILQCSRRSRVFLAVGGEAVSKVGGHVDFRVLGVERRTTTGNEMGGRGATCETERGSERVLRSVNNPGPEPGSESFNKATKPPKPPVLPDAEWMGKGKMAEGPGAAEERYVAVSPVWKAHFRGWRCRTSWCCCRPSWTSGGEQEGVAGFVGGLAGWRRSGDSAVDKRATSEQARPLENVDRLRQPLP